MTDWLRLVGELYGLVLPFAAVIDVAVWGTVAVHALRATAPSRGHRRGLAVGAGVSMAGLALDPTPWRAVAAWAVYAAGHVMWTRVDTPR